jgi:hypothetical protein
MADAELTFKNARAVELKRKDPELQSWQLAERLGVPRQMIDLWLREAGLGQRRDRVRR